MNVKVLVTQLCPTLCDPIDCIVHQAPPSTKFSRQEYWRGLPFPSPTIATEKNSWKIELPGDCKIRHLNSAQVVLVVKILLANAGDIKDAGLIPGSGRSPREETATYSSIPAWKIPWTEEPGGLVHGLQRVRHDWSNLACKLCPILWLTLKPFIGETAFNQLRLK